jgi:TFIIF-interacting CTD phosphatase-like protein
VTDKEKLLIVDLDETLIYATETPLSRKEDFFVAPYYVYKRPNLQPFLTTCLKWFELAIWTSSSPDYATEIVAAIFKDPESLSFIWASNRCSIAYDPEYCEHYYRKTLKKAKRKGYRLESIIVVDDTPRKWEQSYGNLIQISPFEGDETDEELKYLLFYLDKLRHEKNIRAIDKRFWRNQLGIVLR